MGKSTIGNRFTLRNYYRNRFGGTNKFFGNGTMLFGTQNTIYCEELVHYAMAQRVNPKRVLLVSGGYAGLTDELKNTTGLKLIM